MAKQTAEDLKLLTSLEDILSKKVSERLRGAREANELRNELLNTLKSENDLTDKLISSFETYKEVVNNVLETSDKSKQVLDSEIDAVDKILKLEKERKIGQKAIEDSLNNQIDSLTSMVGNIPFIGDSLKEAIDVDSLKDTVSSISESFTQGFSKAGLESGSLVDKMKGGFSAVTSNIGELANGISFATIKQGILNVVTSINPYVLIIASVVALIALIKKLVSLGLEFNQNTTNLAKDLGVSVDEARDMEESFNQISGSSKNLSTTTKKLIEAQKQLSSATGMTSQFSTQMLEDQIKLTKYMGLSGDEAANFQKIAISNGQTARELQGEIAGSVEQFNNATGASVSLKQVMQDIAKLPTDIRVGFNGTNGELAQTVALARTMGTTLEESVAAAEKTLDIESSLKAEAKARVLTGVNINNNAIRAAQIAGDYGKVLSLQREQLAEIDNFNEMAPYQQKAIADAMGMTVDQVVKQKEQMELARKAGIDLETATLDQLKNAQGLNDIERDKLIKQHEQMSAQEKLSAMQEKIGDLINSIVAGPLGEFVGVLVDSLLPAFEAIQTVLSPIFKILGYILKVVFGIINPIIKLGAFIVDLLFTPLESIFGIVDGVIMLFEDFDKGIVMIGNSLIDYLLYPLEMAAKLADGIVSVFTLGFADLGAEAGVKGMADSMKTEVPQNAVTADGEKIDDGIVKPDGTVVKTNPADYIMAMKNPMDFISNIPTPFDMVGDALDGIGNMFGGGGESTSIDYDRLAEAISKQPIMITVDGKVVSEITRVQSKQSSFRK